MKSVATKDISDLQVLKAYEQADITGGVFPYDLLQKWTGQPFKVCWRAMERACGRGLVEYGVSLRSGWITDKGLFLLKESL